MSEIVDLGEFRSAYLAEVEELVSTADACLLEIASASTAGRASPRHVRELARALHTIKGLSAMVGVEPIVALAHRMESAARPMARSNRAFDERTLEALLAGVRAIEQRVADVVGGKPVTDPPDALLRALGAGSRPDRSESPPPELPLDPSIVGKLAPDEVERLARAGDDGERSIAITFRSSPAKSAAGLGINEVRSGLARVAELVRVLPRSVAPSPDAPSGLAFLLLALSRASDDELRGAVGDPSVEIAVLAEARSPGSAPIEAEPDDRLAAPELRRAGTLRVEIGRVDDALEKLSAMIVTRSRLALAIADLSAAGADIRELRAIAQDTARQIRELRAAMLRVRMVPVAEVLERLPLIARDLRRTSGKNVRLAIDTTGAELDKSVGERLLPVFVHLLRNAVDHGIETPEERAHLGKPAEGTVRITASMHASRRLELRIADDGRGIDVEAIAARAGKAGPLGPRELVDILSTPGFSTRQVVTTTSGRGMGMDIVRKIAVDELGGELLLETERGRGTTFILRVPLTIAVIDAFTVRCGGVRFAVPVPAVDEIVEIDPSDVIEPPQSAGRRVRLLRRRGEALPLVDLAATFALPQTADARHAIVVRRGREPLAFALDRVLGQQETVVRPLEDPLVRSPGIAGATDLGDGKPTLVVDLIALGTLVAGAEERAA